MRFRRLNQEELNALEEDFVRYLSSNSISAEDWVTMKNERTEEAEAMIDHFSDLVWVKVLDKARYLEHRSPSEMRVFYCGTTRMVLMGMKVSGSQLDMTKPGDLEQLAADTNASVEVYTSHKDYEKPREEELFALISAGCEVTDDRLFNLLSSMYANQTPQK